MRRMLVLAALTGVGLLVVRAARRAGPSLHERLAARCESMFERMPDTLPPKRMMRGIDELQVTTARVLRLLEAQAGVAHDAA